MRNRYINMLLKLSGHSMFSLGRTTVIASLAISAMFLLNLMAGVTDSQSAPMLQAPDPSQVQITLEGCRNDGSITLPNVDGDFICPDSAYTTGNLGKGWNELDLVPHRLTTMVGNQDGATTFYAIAVTADHKDAGAPGYDVLSEPTINDDKSDNSCQITVGPEQVASPGVGGTDESLYRILEITQDMGTTCVFDYYERLALGSHLFPGSSLHSNLTNQNLGTQGIGAKDVSIPVKEILPQELNKTMTATQDQIHEWAISKETNPASLIFNNTCDPDSPTSQTVQISVTWTKLAATQSGDITVKTEVKAKNPAARTITVNVTDEIRSGTTVLDTLNSGDIDVPANTEMVVLSHMLTVPEGTTELNDVATATYTDKVTGVPVPGNTTAEAQATVEPSGVVQNATATINDVESITGANLSFSVDSFTGASGAFDNSYVAGTETTGPVSWTSDEQSDSGSVSFTKSVYIAEGTSTSGTLSDTATVTGSDGFTKEATADVSISASATVQLTIEKTIPNILQNTDTASFDFKVTGPNNYENTVTLNFAAGETSKSTTLTDLAPGTYTVNEQPQSGWVDPDGDNGRSIDLNLPTCTATESYTNASLPDRNIRKVR